MRKKIYLSGFLKDSVFEKVQRYDAYRENTLYKYLERNHRRRNNTHALSIFYLHYHFIPREHNSPFNSVSTVNFQQ